MNPMNLTFSCIIEETKAAAQRKYYQLQDKESASLQIFLQLQ